MGEGEGGAATMSDHTRRSCLVLLPAATGEKRYFRDKKL